MNQSAPTPTGRITHLLKEAASLHGQGRPRAALSILQQALAIDPVNLDALHGTAVMFAQIGDFTNALAHIDRVVTLRPDNPAAHYNRAKILYELERYDEALAGYDRTLSLKPNLAEAHNNRAETLYRLHRLREAVSGYSKSIALNPASAESLYNRANALRDLNRHDDALADYDAAIGLKADQPEAYNNRGTLLTELGRPAEALSDFDRATALKPGYPEAYNNRGIALKALGRNPEALTEFDEAIALRPDYAEAYNNRGTTLAELDRPAEALSSLDRAISLKPGYIEAYNNQACTLVRLHRHHEALESFGHAIALNPDYAEVHNNRGACLQDLKRYDEALAGFDLAIGLKPDYAEAILNKAFLLLLRGDFRRAWPLFEWRWKTEHLSPSFRDFGRPLWSGDECIAGKTILLHAEQGLGDAIQYVRYAPMVAALGGRVVLEVPPSLATLFRTLKVPVRIITAGDPLPAFDLHCPLMSLPRAFATTVESIPSQTPYLAAPPGHRHRWRKRLGPRGRPRIGLAWSGNPRHQNDHNRSIALRRMKALFAPDLEYHSLQKEVRREDRGAMDDTVALRTHEDVLQDLADTAALIGELDLIISVDTSIAHLAGSLGKEVWILLPYSPDHRWLTDRSDSPWYPSARLFRQERIGDWDSVIDNVHLNQRARFANAAR